MNISYEYFYPFSVKNNPSTDLPCGVPEDVRKVAYCTFWMNFAKSKNDDNDFCIQNRELAKNCFNLEGYTSLATSGGTTAAESTTAEMSTNLGETSHDTSANMVDGTNGPLEFASEETSEPATETQQ